MAAAYFGAAKLGLALRFDNSAVAAIWPPAGLALASLLIWGPRMWPAVAVGALAANLTVTGSFAAVLGITAGSTLEPVLGAFLLRRAGFRRTLDRTRDVFALVLLAAALSTALSASLGVFSLWADGSLATVRLAAAWRVSWLADLSGDLLVAPAILLLLTRPRISRSRGRRAEAVCVGAALTAVSLVVFAGSAPLVYPVFPLLFWVALRFRQAGAALAGVLASGIALWYTAHGRGPFAGGKLDIDVLRAQAFVIVTTITALLVAAARTEARAAADAERRLAEAQQLANVGSWEWLIASNEITWSAEMYRIYGVDPAGFRASFEAFLELVHVDDRARVSKTIEAALADGAPFNFEHLIIRPDGQIRTLQARGEIIADSAGQAVAMRGTGQDITERRREQEQVAAAARYFELSSDLICTTGFDGYLKQVNAVWTKTLGWSEAELLERKFIEFVHPDDRKDSNEQRAQLLEGHATDDFTHRLLAKNGEWHWIEWNATSIAEDALIYASGRDVTAGRAAQSALRASEDHFRLMVEAIEDYAILLLDADGHVATWNPGAQRFKGYLAEEIIGQHFSVFYPPEDIADGKPERELAIARAEGRMEDEGWRVRRNGERFWANVVITALRDTDGSLRGYGKITRDVTERKRVQEELAMTRDQALEASRLKSEFVANMSHEIRTPLNGLIGLTGLLSDTELTPEQHDYADAMRTSGDALMTIIDDILDFSKIEAGKLELENELFDARLVVEDVCSIVAVHARENRVALIPRVDASTPHAAMGDRNRVRQVLLNLTTNAVKFSAQGVVSVGVRGEPLQGQAGTQMYFEVADSGIGIEPAALKRIFESFSQGDGSTTRRYGGTGLGLAICKKLVDLMGGEFGVRSTAGEGSTFWFTVPTGLATGADSTAAASDFTGATAVVARNRAAPQGGPHPSSVAPAGEAAEAMQEATGLEPRRPLLVAEDNPVNQLVAVRLLEKRGFSVDVAANGRDALRMSERGDYAAIFMDCQMPELDGFGATEEIRRSEGADRHTPIIAMTANRMKGDRERCLAAGMDDYLGKPVTPEQLDAVIARALAPTVPPGDDSRVRREPAPPSSPEAQVLDHSALADAASGDERLRSDLVQLFLSDAGEQVRQLANAVAGGDADAIQAAAHRLKGGSAAVGAVQLAEVSAQLCNAARTGQMTGTPQLQAELERSFALTSHALAPVFAQSNAND